MEDSSYTEHFKPLPPAPPQCDIMYYLPLRCAPGSSEEYERGGTLTTLDPMILGAGDAVENYLKLNFNFKDIPPSDDDFLNSEAKKWDVALRERFVVASRQVFKVI
jgi:hypothetical protein